MFWNQCIPRKEMRHVSAFSSKFSLNLSTEEVWVHIKYVIQIELFLYQYLFASLVTLEDFTIKGWVHCKCFLINTLKGPHFLFWISGVVSFNTWLILNWKDNNWRYKLRNSTNDNFDHFKWNRCNYIAHFLSLRLLKFNRENEDQPDQVCVTLQMFTDKLQTNYRQTNV